MDKKTGLLIGAALVTISSGLFAADAACSGGVGTSASIATAGKFIVNSFSMKCSKNVHLDYSETNTAIGVCAASAKGNKTYGGTSEGGAVKEVTDYTSGAVTANTTSGC
jgi:hypothetical protein